MKNLVVSVFLLVVSATANAGIINIDTSNWLHLAGPSNGRTTGNWVGLNRQEPEKRSNSSGALVSNFVLFGDFLFSGNFSPTTVEFDDNDIVGLVFGWQDERNHYRLGWTQTQRPDSSDDRSMTDITGRTGMFLIREVDGLSRTLFNINNLFWEDDAKYSFDVRRTDNRLNIDFGGQVFSIEDSTFNLGRIGVYTESQTARFWNLSANGNTPNSNAQKVPEPGVIMFLSGLLLSVAAFRRTRKQADSV